MPRVHHVRQATHVLVVAVGLIGIGAVANAQTPFPAPRDADGAPRKAVTTSDQPRRAPPAPRARPWTFEVRGGVGLSTNPTTGTSQLPGLGNVIFQAESGFGPARTVSSWLFGDGAAQLNAFAPTRSLPPLPTLDTMLTSLGAARSAGGTLGFAIDRDLSPHLALEFTVDANLQPLRMTSAATSAIEATRAGFINTWQALLLSARSGPLTGLAVAATTTGATSAGGQVEATGSVRYRLRPSAKLDPFITLGAGVLANTGSTPSPVLTGTYQFTFPISGFLIPYKQTDAVTIHALDGGARLVGVVGGGVDRALSAHSGIRFAARATIVANRAETTLDTNPGSQMSVPQEGLFFQSAPTTIIINNGSLPSTLSAAPLAGFQTFVGRGMRIESTITVGYFFRF
jgi:hypothetical protein